MSFLCHYQSELEYHSPCLPLLIKQKTFSFAAIAWFLRCSAKTKTTQTWMSIWMQLQQLSLRHLLSYSLGSILSFGKMTNSCPSKWTENVFTGIKMHCAKSQLGYDFSPCLSLPVASREEQSYVVLLTHPCTYMQTLTTGFWSNIISADTIINQSILVIFFPTMLS